MRTSQRSLCAPGNDKLSKSVFHFDLPAGLTCPGKSELCSSKCYARKGRFNFPQVQDRLNWCYEQSKRDDFVDRMVEEIYRNGILLMRWHCSGDVYSPAYARKVYDVIESSRHCEFWLYTRSWTVRTFDEVLDDISSLQNVKLWFSADNETGLPKAMPSNVRVAWLQTKWDEESLEADLIFLDHPLRKQIPPHEFVEKICPTETEAGKEQGISCATCGLCWR